MCTLYQRNFLFYPVSIAVFSKVTVPELSLGAFSEDRWFDRPPLPVPEFTRALDLGLLTLQGGSQCWTPLHTIEDPLAPLHIGKLA
jgi:hypothetical protein